jgi:hypothetical protein
VAASASAYSFRDAPQADRRQVAHDDNREPAKAGISKEKTAVSEVIMLASGSPLRAVHSKRPEEDDWRVMLLATRSATADRNRESLGEANQRMSVGLH